MDRDDAWHRRVVAWWRRATEEILIPAPVLPEITYLLHTRLGSRAELAFLRAVVSGEFSVEPLFPEDLARSADIMAIYADTPLGFVDASVAATAERLAVISILTTDRRHFSIIRPQHVSAFQLLP